MTTADLVYERLKQLPEALATEVLHYTEYLVEKGSSVGDLGRAAKATTWEEMRPELEHVQKALARLGLKDVTQAVIDEREDSR